MTLMRLLELFALSVREHSWRTVIPIHRLNQLWLLRSQRMICGSSLDSFILIHLRSVRVLILIHKEKINELVEATSEDQGRGVCCCGTCYCRCFESGDEHLPSCNVASPGYDIGSTCHRVS